MATFNKTHEMIRKMVRELCRDKIAELASEADKTKVYPQALHDIFIDAGLFVIRVPEAYDGGGMDYTSSIIVVEELARVDGTCANTVAHHHAGLCSFMKGASQEQKDRYLPKIGKGDYLVGFALTEPDAGSDAFSLRMSAMPDGKDYLLNGNKCFISNSGLTDVYVVFATVDPKLGRNGITAFLVEKDTPGFTVGKAEKKMGFRASPTCELIFDNARVPKENLLGEEGQGWQLVHQSLTETRVMVAAMGLGMAQGAMEAAVAHAKKREQFGTPIKSFQGVSFMLADMAIQVELARSLVYEIAEKVDRGEKNLHYYASIAKCAASDIAMKVTTDAVQVLGGYGYTEDYPVEKLMRDAKATQIIEGTNQIQRIQIARHLFKIY
jgi:alkylation response protein AidB-like acyl-CoA dehydrogenase